MSGKVFRRQGRAGYLVVGYTKLALFQHKKQAFDYAATLQPPRLEDEARALPGWEEIQQ